MPDSAAACAFVTSLKSNGGETGKLIAVHEWSQTTAGAIDTWSQSLRTAVGIMLRSPVPIVMLWGEDGVMLYNDAYSVFAGGRHPYLLGSKVREGWPEVADFNDHVMKTCLAGGTLAYVDQELTLHRSGVPEQVWMNLDYSPIPDENGRPAGVIAIVVETTRRVLAERRQRAELDRLWTLSEDMLARADYDGAMSAVNPAWTQVLGWSERELLTNPYADIIHPDNVAATVAALTRMSETGQPTRFENLILAKDGQWKPIGWTVSPEPDGINFIAVGRDLTEYKARENELIHAQEALRQAQKMEAVGQLTGGIAHDFNNMLAVVLGSLELLGRRVDPDDARARHYVQAATDSAKRAANLTQRLLAFSRQQPLQPEQIDANKLVAGMSDMLRHSIGVDVRLETILADELWPVEVDPNQLESVILNLSVNARDAMPGGGKLIIETQNADLDSRYTASELGVPAGQYVLIAITDTGAGMTPEVIAKAFDPFFTTKAVGKGTGLGLSQVYGFVKQSGGHIKIYSEVGQGSSIRIYLPRSITAAAAPGTAEATEDLPTSQQQEVILVVDDEPAVRQFSADALTELGYRVFDADNATVALTILRAHPEIAMLFTDIVMPDANGRVLADRAQQIRPDLKVLYTTGYTRDAVVHNGVVDKGVHLIGKPFSIDELASRVREVLDMA